MNIILIELIIFAVAGIAAILIGRYYTYNHPIENQMKAKRKAALEDEKLQEHAAAGRHRQAIARYVELTGLSSAEAERILKEKLF